MSFRTRKVRCDRPSARFLGAVGTRALGYINLAADNGFDAFATAGFEKFDRAVHDAVIGQGDRVDAVFTAMLGQLRDSDDPVEQRIFAMNMKDGKIGRSR